MSAVLPIRMVEKPWGRNILPAPFTAPQGQCIGELWFEPPPLLPQLLVKYIFTSEKLSVQVHPSDTQFPGNGKEECWLVIDAQPGASLGIGFNQPLDVKTMRAAAMDGSIEQLLEWHPVKVGDFFYIPANTVHAIGAGVCLIEIQQTSDVTYRLYDYGRPRELHLDDGIAVSHGERYPIALRNSVAPNESKTLVDGPIFRLDHLFGAPSSDVMARYLGNPALIIPETESCHIGKETIHAGQCAVVDSLLDVIFSPSGTTLIAQPC